MSAAPSAPPTPEAEHDPRVVLGKTLYAGGGLALAVGAGVALGWYLGDRGARWLPTLLGALSLLGCAALLAMVWGSYLLGPLRGRPRGRRRIVVGAALIVVLCLVRLGVAWLARPSPLSSLELSDYRRVFAEDAARYRELDATLGGALRTIGGQGAIAAPGDPPRVLTADEEEAVAASFAAWVHGALALDRIRAFHEDYYRFDTGRAERDRHLRSFLLTFAAELCLYERTATLIELTDKNSNVKTFLDTPRPARGLGEGSLTFVRDELAGLSDLPRVVAGKQWLAFLATTCQAEEEARASGYGWLWDAVQAQLTAIERRAGPKLTALTLKASVAPLGRRAKALVFPVQKEVAEAMGDIKVLRRGTYLIGPELLAQLMPQLAPGDVLLGRKNWYLSNIGLPGFWPHAILYVGDDAQLAAAFDREPAVTAWVQQQDPQARTFSGLLARRFPGLWAERQQSHEPLTVIEAVSEGVLQHDLGHAAGDYLAALRPRLPAVAKAQAIARAFAYVGRPYDFDFDFTTDHALVCSELVWRSYRPYAGMAGLDMPTVRIAAREALPPQEYAKRYAAERELPEDQRLFDFVLFVDALEGEQRAVVSDEPTFRATATRTKWDVAQR
ncbi:MAG: YiiX/YebB-like N1pC/P60 family cysteine hydrolase [Planctomycetota bacterium]